MIIKRKQAVVNLAYAEKKLHRFQKLYHKRAILKGELDQVAQTTISKNN